MLILLKSYGLFIIRFQPHRYTMHSIKTITVSEVLELLEKYLGLVISRSTIYHYMNHHSFPLPYKLGRPKRWREDKVKKWIATQIKKSR